jgi:hypothetical protein
MNRRRLLQNAGLAGLGASLTTSLMAAQAPKPATGPRPGSAPIPPISEAPTVYAPTADAATVIWPVAGPSLGWVEYGEEGSGDSASQLERGDGIGFIPHGDQVIRVRLQGLKPGRKHWFRTHTQALEGPASPALGRPVQVGARYDLTRPDPGATETRFTVWNDTHDHIDTLAKLGPMTREEPADFLFWNGDVSNNINAEAIIPSLYLQPRGEVDLARGPAILFSRGNHDVRGLAANRLGDYIDFPTGRPYYSFRSGPVGAIVLDTGEDKPDDHFSFGGLVDFARLIQTQARWLDEEIEKPHLKDAPYRVVFCHIPLRWRDETPPNYDTGGFDHVSLRGRAAWHDALVRWGAQLIVSGHTHQTYHMPATSEHPYEQLIGGGPRPESARLIRAHADSSGLTFRMFKVTDGQETFSRTYRPLV